MSDFDSDNNNLMPDGSRVRQQKLNPYAIKNSNMGAVVVGTNNRVIDTFGLASTANFASGNVVDNTNRDTTSSTYVDVPVATIPLILERQAKVLILISFNFLIFNLTVGNFGIATYQLVIDDAQDPYVLVEAATDLDGSHISQNYCLFYQKISVLEAGTHTIKLRNKLSRLGSETLRTFATSLTYLVLGN